jgi:hypothetical protein
MTSHFHPSHRLLAVLAMLAAALGVLGLASVPALARQVHYYSKSFGTAGSGAGQLSEPSGVAVSEVGASSGDVYAIDQGNDRVEVFGPEGAYISQFNGAATPAKSFSWQNSPFMPETIAVDNSTNPLDPSKGDVYVTDSGNRAIDKFTAAGGYLGQITTGSLGLPLGGMNESGESDQIGVTVDQQGVVWVFQRTEQEHYAQVDSFSDAVENVLDSSFSDTNVFEGGPLAVDSEGDLYTSGVYNRLVKLSPSGQRLPFVYEEPGSDVAIDPSTGELYLDRSRYSVNQHLEEGPGSIGAVSTTGSLIQTFGSEPLDLSGFGVAVNASSKVVYATSRGADAVRIFQPATLPDVSTAEAGGLQSEGTATLNGTVDPGGVSLTICRFEYATEEEYASAQEYTQSAPCSQVPSGSTPTAVHAQIAVAADTRYHYRLVAGNENREVEDGEAAGEDKPFDAPARPAVEGESVSGTTSTSATVSARINPGGALTSYRVEYGAGEVFGSSTSEVTLGAGLQSAGVQVHIGGLQAGAVHHFRFVATNALGSVLGGEVAFATPRSASASGLTLPDNRAYELVSSPTSGANVFRPSQPRVSDKADFQSARPMRAAADGDEVAFLGEPPRASTGEGSGNTNEGVGNQYIAVRDASGWTDTDLQFTPEIEYVNFSSDLSQAVLVSESSGTLPGAEPTLAADCGDGNDLYSRTMGDGIYHALVASPIPGPTYCGGEFAGSSANGSHLLFESEALLTPEAKSGGEGHFDLYDSVGGQLHLVNVLPDGEPDDNARFGSPTARSSSLESANYDNVISAEGSRVFWSEVSQRGRFHDDIDALFVRENDSEPQSPLGPGGECTVADDACTVRIDVPEVGAEGGPGAGEFWTASGDGSKVFFTDCSRLTKGSTAIPTSNCGESEEEQYTPRGKDLYEYDAETGRLTDLTVDRHPGDSLGADVQGVIGINETGEAGAYVYLVADGVLAGKNAEGEAPASGQPNLYLYRNGAMSFIATLSETDNRFENFSDREVGDWRPEAGVRTAEPTPDGHSLVFMSSQSLAGHETGGYAEVFVYDADTGRISCASCNPDGTPSNYGAHVPISTYNTFMHRWISEDGSRVFFETDEALVPQDTNGAQDVYEWEREGAGSCTQAGGCVYLLSGTAGAENAYLIDASADGDDVFFATRTTLVPRAQAGIMGLYDARVGGGFPESSVACTGSGCQGVPPAPPIFSTPASVTFSGVGNFEPQAQAIEKAKPKSLKCVKGKVRKAERCVKKRKVREQARGRKRAKKSGTAGSSKGRK